METITHIQKVQIQNQTVREQIQHLLGWSRLQYAEFQEEMGYAYLEYEFGLYTPMVNLLPYEKTFWSWWINHWVKRDIAFLKEAYKYNDHWRVIAYKTGNRPNSIHFKNHIKMLRLSYNGMINTLIKEVHNG